MTIMRFVVAAVVLAVGIRQAYQSWFKSEELKQKMKDRAEDQREWSSLRERGPAMVERPIWIWAERIFSAVLIAFGLIFAYWAFASL